MKVQSRCYKTHNARLLHAKQKAEAKNKNNNSFLLCCLWQSHALLLLFFSIELSEEKRRQAKQSQEREKITVLGNVNLQSSADSVIKATKLTITVEIKAHYYAVNNNNCNLNAKDSDGSCSVSVRHTHTVYVRHLHTDIFFSICVCSWGSFSFSLSSTLGAAVRSMDYSFVRRVWKIENLTYATEMGKYYTRIPVECVCVFYINFMSAR